MKIEVLYFEDCPNFEPAERLLRDTLEELGVDAEIELVKVTDNDEAMANRFLGSPSIRINGNDLESEESESTQYSMRCRIYRTDKGQSGVPSKILLVSALRRAESA